MKNNWPTKKLGEIAPFLRGVGLSKKDLTSSGAYKCILYGQLYTTYGQVIDEIKSKTDKNGSMLSVSGDVLVPGTTTADEIGIAVASALNEGGVIIGGDINIIRTKNKTLNSKFLAYLLSGPFKMRMAKYARGTNIIHLSGKDIAKIEVPIPPMQIQKQIVEKLDKIAEAQKLNDKLIQKTDELFQSLLHKELNPAGKNWEVKKLGEVSDIIMGQSPPSSSYNERGEGLPFFQGKAEFGEIYPVPVKYCSSPSRIAEADDVLMSVRAPVGNINIAKEKSCVGRGLGALRAKKNILNQMFLFYFMKKNENNWSRLSTGSTFSAIRGSNLRNFEIPVPPLKIQKQIVAKLSAVQNYKKQLLEQKTKLKVLFDSALHMSIKK